MKKIPYTYTRPRYQQLKTGHLYDGNDDDECKLGQCVKVELALIHQVVGRE